MKTMLKIITIFVLMLFIQNIVMTSTYAITLNTNNEIVDNSVKIQNISDDEDKRLFDSKIEQALSWISNQKDAENFWGKGDLQLYYTTEIMNLNDFKNNKPKFENESSSMYSLDNNDFLSRYLSLNGNEDLKKKLLDSKNIDLGWGYTTSYQSTVWDTYVVASYLIEDNVISTDTVSAINYLLANQNNDGGWSYVKGEDSNTYLTSEVVCLLNTFISKVSGIGDEVKAKVKKGATFISSKRDPINYWGLSDKDINTTFVALKALQGHEKIDYFEDYKTKVFEQQKSNFSWGNDLISTKNAIEVLRIVIEETTDIVDKIKIGKVSETGFVENNKFSAYETMGVSAEYKISNLEKRELEAFIKYPSGHLEKIEIIENSLTWNTKNSPSGTYKIILQIKDKESGQVTANAESEFSIIDTFNINNVVSKVTPNKVVILTDTVVKNKITLYYSANCKKDAVVRTVIKDKAGKEQISEKIIKLDPSIDKIDIDLGEFIPKTFEATDYSITNTVTVDGKAFSSDEKFKVVGEIKNEQLELKNTLSKDWLSPGKDSTQLLMDLIGSKNGDDIAVKPVDLTFVIDTSGSMSEYDGTGKTRLQHAKYAANSIIDLLNPEDRVAVVKFTSSASTLVKYTNKFSEAKTSINSLRESGGTNIYNALNHTYEYMQSVANTENVDREKLVIFLTDGQDGSTVSNIRNIAKKFKNPVSGNFNMDATISSIGLSAGVKAELLKAMSDETAGEYVYTPTAEDLKALMVELTGNVLNISALDLELMIHLNNNDLKLKNIKLDDKVIQTNSTEIKQEVQPDGSIILKWNKSSVALTDKFNLSLDFEGDDLLTNSEIDLLRDGYLKYKNPNGTIEHIKLSNFPVKVGIYKVNDDISLDKDGYFSNENVNINIKSTNITDSDINLKTVYQIIDSNGQVIDTIETLDNNKYMAKEVKDINLTWNT
ncbi:MAG: VWA domain-containing protein, partial [Clostridium sp.]